MVESRSENYIIYNLMQSMLKPQSFMLWLVTNETYKKHIEHFTIGKGPNVLGFFNQ